MFVTPTRVNIIKTTQTSNIKYKYCLFYSGERDNQKIHKSVFACINDCTNHKQIFENFCKGINFRIDEAFNDLPLEFKILGFKPNYWDPTIVAGYARMMAHEMSGSWKPEVIFGAVESYFGKEMLNDILPGEEVDIPTIANGLPVSILQSLDNVIESEYSTRNLFGDISADIGCYLFRGRDKRESHFWIVC